MCSALSNAKDKASSLGFEPVYSAIVTEAHSLINTTKIVVISSPKLLIFSKNGEVLANSCSWFNIKKYKFENNYIRLRFKDGNFILKTYDVLDLHEAIIGVLGKILAQSELNKLGMCIKSQPSRYGVLLRAKETTPLIYKSIDRIIKFTLTYVIIADAFLQDYISILPLLTFVNHIKIIIKSEDCVKSNNFINYLKSDTNIEKIDFCGKVSNIPNILHAIVENKASSIMALGFQDTLFDQGDIDSIISFIKLKNIKIFGFHNCFDDNNCELFSKLQYEIGYSLQFLNISNSLKMLNPIFTKDLVMLSIAHCNVDISNFFSVLFAEYDMLNNLRVIDISGNTCSLNLPDDVHFPRQLISVYADNVSWSKHKFLDFLSVIFKACYRGLYLSVSNTNIHQSEWVDIAKYLDNNLFSSLISLDWTGNPVCSQFFTFLRRNKGLVTLNLSGIFGSSDKIAVAMLRSYLRKAKMLRRIIIRGSENAFLGENIVDVIYAIKKNGNIQYIDLSDNNGGDKSYDQLIQYLLAPGNLKEIDFDGNQPSSIDVLNNVVGVLFRNGSPYFRYSFPDMDLNSCISSPSHMPQVELFTQKFVEAYNDYQDHPALKPCTVPKMHFKASFPNLTTCSHIIETLSLPFIPEDELKRIKCEVLNNIRLLKSRQNYIAVHYDETIDYDDNILRCIGEPPATALFGGPLINNCISSEHHTDLLSSTPISKKSKYCMIDSEENTGVMTSPLCKSKKDSIVKLPTPPSSEIEDVDQPNSKIEKDAGDVQISTMTPKTNENTQNSNDDSGESHPKLPVKKRRVIHSHKDVLKEEMRQLMYLYRKYRRKKRKEERKNKEGDVTDKNFEDVQNLSPLDDSRQNINGKEIPGEKSQQVVESKANSGNITSAKVSSSSQVKESSFLQALETLPKDESSGLAHTKSSNRDNDTVSEKIPAPNRVLDEENARMKMKKNLDHEANKKRRDPPALAVEINYV